MNVSDKTITTITRPTGQIIATIADDVVQSVNQCSDICIWLGRLQKKVQLIALGGTRKSVPGVRIGDELLVSNVFTVSRREGWPVRRTFGIYQEVIRRLQAQPISGILRVNTICACSTSMEFLDSYTLLDNTSAYTPPQHKGKAWADNHTASEFENVLAKIRASVSMLHRLDIIHTDITGFNILVDSENNPMIIDLFSCVTVDALGPVWFPKSWKSWIGQKIELAQINQYLLAPATKRWSKEFIW